MTNHDTVTSPDLFQDFERERTIDLKTLVDAGVISPAGCECRWRHLPWLLALTLFLAVVFCRAWLCDDAFLSFRTADNLVNGYGLTWNIDERVQAYSHPLWLFLFSLFYSFTREPYYTAIVLSLVVTAAAAVVYALKIATSGMVAALGILLLTISVAFVDYSTSGLENPLTHLLVALFVWQFVARTTANGSATCPAPADDQPTATAPAVSGGRRILGVDAATFVLSLLAALAAVNRLDTVLLFLPALVFVLWKERTWRCLWSMAVGALPLILWMVFAVIYYGFPLPNAAYAWFNNGIGWASLAAQGCYYLWNSLKHDPVTVAVIVGGLALGVWQRKSRRVWIAAGLALYVLYVVAVGGDFMSGRYLTAPLFAAVCLFGSIAWVRVITWVPVAAALAVLWLSFSNPLQSVNADFSMVRSQIWLETVAEHGIGDERALYYNGFGLLRALTTPRSMFPKFPWVTTGKQLRVLSAHRPEKIVVRSESVGVLGYYGGPGVHWVDTPAVADPLLARLPPMPDPYWRIGTLFRAIPSGYIETLRSGKNTIHQPELREYYDHLALITQGDLWDQRRWAALGKMNFGGYGELLEPARRDIRMMLPPLTLLPDPTKAIEDISRAISRFPKDASNFKYRGELYAKSGKQTEAIQDFTQVLELEPDNAFVFNRRGTLFAQQGKRAKAMADFSRAIELDPYCEDAYVNRGARHAQADNTAAAIVDFSRAIDIAPTKNSAFTDRGTLYAEMGDWRHALADFRKLIDLNPLIPASYHLMATTLVDAGDLDSVYELPDKSPGDLVAAMRSLAWILATHPDAEYRNGADAVRFAERAWTMESKKTARTLDVLAASYAEAGRFAQAVATAEQAIQLLTATSPTETVKPLPETPGETEQAPDSSRGFAVAIAARLEKYKAHEPYHVPLTAE